MALSTTQYGYIIDPMVPFTDDKGNTIKNGFVRVFVAGSSTPVITYRNFDGAANQDLIELDNSGRTKTSVIGSKVLTYKVCVYDAFHSQESPILTVDNVSVIGASITAESGATVVTSVEGTEGEIAVTAYTDPATGIQTFIVGLDSRFSGQVQQNTEDIAAINEDVQELDEAVAGIGAKGLLVVNGQLRFG